MSKRRFRALFAITVCAHAESMIAAALCLGGLLPVLLLGAAILPEKWLLVGQTTIVPVAGILIFQKWLGRGILADSVMTIALLIAARFRRSVLSMLVTVQLPSLRC
jgi:hypothetical protein